MYSKTLSLVALAGIAQAHMSMYYPPPLGAAPSINKQSTSLDKEFNFPLGCCGSDGGPDINSPGICRGHLDKYDTETPQVTWQPGQDAYFQLTDFTYDPEAPGGTHSGGSCQVGFSVDKGTTWKVAASYHGACPYETTDGSPETQTFDFNVPTGMPEGDALFAWVWLNREHESFVNCAKVHIGGDGSGSNSTSPAQPYQPSTPSQSTTSPQQPAQSSTTPKQPSQSSYSVGPSDGDSSPASHTGHHYHHSTATASYGSKSTQSADNDNSNSNDSDSESGSGFDGSDSQDSSNSDPDSESKSNSNNESDSDDSPSTSYKAHNPVKPGTRRYVVEGAKCDCTHDELTLATRCSCQAPFEKRTSIERQALRMHRRNMVKRVDACDWATAPSMETSYYTKDAKCAPNAKINYPQSDDFELKWDVSCGVVLGKTDYQLKTMECNMYAAH